MKQFIATILLLLITPLSYSQCGNTDFELGNFTGWTGKLGLCCPINLPNNGIVNGRQTIMTQGIDPNTCGGLRRVFQGTYSARVGNSNIGAQAEGLYYTFVVSPSTTLIRYAYAVVFQAPGHAAADQPRFQSRVRLANGSVIACTDYTVVADSNLTGFNYCVPLPGATPVAWKNWSVVALDLAGYIGQTVTLEFETGDCNLGGHYGYAYVDGIQCGRVNDVIPYCQGANPITLSASDGFVSYQWDTGDTTQTISINPNLYDTLHCVVTTYTGCQITLQYILTPTANTPSFTASNVCLGVPVQFVNTTTPAQGTVNVYNWNLGDNTTTTVTSPTHTYATVGTYNVTLTASVTGTTCTASTQGQVTVHPLPTISPITHN